MRTVSKLMIAGVVGLFLAVSCGSTEPSPGTGTGGNGGSATGGSGGADASCLYMHYFSAGCDVPPRCTGIGGACGGYACGCDGRIITGCANEFAEAYAYLIPFSTQPDASLPAPGQACDPNSPPVK